jgi:hypothetical protein
MRDVEPIILLFASLAIGALRPGLQALVDRLAGTRFGRWLSLKPHEQPAQESLKTRAETVIAKLRASAAETEALVAEMDQIAAARAAAVSNVEDRLATMAAQEEALSKRLEALKELEPDAQQAIAAVLDSSLEREGKRSGRRDYLLFAAGVATPFLIQWLIPIFTGWFN